MCGICGVIGIESSKSSEAIVRRMMAALVHRGPDEEGILLAPPVAVGSRRLSIIDLSGGSQPVWNDAGTLAVVSNGEIYNFRELRTELELSGHKFRTRSDTEVIVHAYEAWGEKCVERLRGMFAFAVVEMPQGRVGRAARVFLARDPLGIKPLYYSLQDGVLLFASEVRALIASGCVPAELSAEAVPSYLLFGSVNEPMTLVDGVASLPPGHFMPVLAATPVHAPEPTPYWDADRVAMQGEGKRSEILDPPARCVRSLLEDSVRGHLIADVPIGVFLSSGLDSTALAALASRVQAGIHTFTVAFPDAKFSEAEKARQTAKRLGTEHSEFMLSSQEMFARLDEAVTAFDQPSMDGINTYFVSWAARQAGLKVALSGLGSDELFGGYASFVNTSRVARLAKMARSFPRTFRASVASLVTRKGFFGSWPDAMRKAMAAWIDPSALPHPYFFTRALFTPQLVEFWLGGRANSWNDSAWGQWLNQAAHETHDMDGFTAVSWLELRSYLVNTLLRDTDAMSMHHSLEVRVPFLDTTLVKYILSLSESEKHRHAKPKSLLIEALRDLLPDEIVAQPKRTFTFPWENWLRGPLGNRVAAGLEDWSPALEPHIAGSVVFGIWEDFLGGRTSWSRPWGLYILNEWVKRNLRVPEKESVPLGRAAAISSF
ncbi:MAG: asparagine synthase (glutamine-hydrolyzing) [Candidatus Acidiferrales bacterium]